MTTKGEKSTNYILGYTILCGLDIGDFNQAIERYIEDDYEPYGGPRLDDGNFYQAMIKYDDLD